MASITASPPRSATPQAQVTLTAIPDELILHILSFLDVPELLCTSRTTHHLRHLSLDPLLHAARLNRASLTIERAIPSRPPLAKLVSHRIFMSNTTIAARRLDRNLIKIRLNRLLSNRVPASRLVERGVLPDEYVYGRLAPTLISTKRRVEKEKIKDVLRSWIEEWRKRGENQREREQEKLDVRILVRRFARSGTGSEEGNGVRQRREEPARARVRELRRFWEGKAT